MAHASKVICSITTRLAVRVCCTWYILGAGWVWKDGDRDMLYAKVGMEEVA
jgi:hypothetical protein